MNYIKIIEDYLCDLCDLAFNDGIVCDKVFNPEEPVNRAAFITQQGNSETDQDGIRTYTAQILENRKTRSECIIDMGIIDKHFRKYRKKLDNGLVINISVSYIISPIRIIVGTQQAYNLSANLEIKLT
jgi:hypothetical protein